MENLEGRAVVYLLPYFMAEAESVPEAHRTGSDRLETDSGRHG